MPTPQKSPSKDFVEAVNALGGPLYAHRLTGTPRVTIIYWMKHGWPSYRQHEVDKLLDLARKSELATLERLTRKYRAK